MPSFFYDRGVMRKELRDLASSNKKNKKIWFLIKRVYSKRCVTIWVYLHFMWLRGGLLRWGNVVFFQGFAFLFLFEKQKFSFMISRVRNGELASVILAS